MYTPGMSRRWVSGVKSPPFCAVLILVFALLALPAVSLVAPPAIAAGTTTTMPAGPVEASGETTSAGAAQTARVVLPEAPSLGVPAAILINMDDGRVLFEQNADVRRAMASTTKIMTGLLGLEHLDYNGTVTASQNACDTGESEMWLEVGEVVPVEQLLYGLMVMSGNDAATCVAESVAGDVAGFVEMMNRRAEQLGLSNTHFANPHGLDAEGHYSSARDLATLGAYAMQNSEFAKMVGTASISFDWAGHTVKREMASHNKLLGKVSYVNGIKTGYTGNAGYCLVGSGSQGGVNLVSVVMGAVTSAACNEDTTKLLEYGFSLYKEQTLVEDGAVVAEVPIPYEPDRRLRLVAEKPLVRTLHLEDTVSQTVDYPEMAPLPVEAGQALGKVVCRVGDKVVGEVDLVAATALAKPTLNDKLSYYWTRFSGWLQSLVS